MWVANDLQDKESKLYMVAASQLPPSHNYIYVTQAWEKGLWAHEILPH